MGLNGRVYPVGTKPTDAAAKGKKGATDHMFAELVACPASSAGIREDG